MALTQTTDVCKDAMTGQTLKPILHIGNGVVRLQYAVTPAMQVLSFEEAAIGSAGATTLLSYINQSTGDFTSAGEARALTRPYRNGTIGDYFA